MAAATTSTKVTKRDAIEKAGQIVSAWATHEITYAQITERACGDTKADGISREARLEIFGSRYALETYIGAPSPRPWNKN